MNPLFMFFFISISFLNAKIHRIWRAQELLFLTSFNCIAYNKDIDKLKRISNFLSDLGMDNRIRGYTVKNLNGVDIRYYYLKVVGKSRYQFYLKIGFSDERKQQRLRLWAQRLGLRKYGGT
ncbi:MAG TPA: hypothetical protein VJJ21_01560 [Candidatus Nanoarchaeia archaeon]|nr:hypothetical protein [Candidatus Nanoarchaeia archaeon]